MNYRQEAPYTANPDGTTTVHNIGEDGYINFQGRMPAFVGLAKATGGLYVENEAGMTSQEALSRAGLDFTVESVPQVSVPVLTPSGVATVTHPDYRMNVAHHKDGTVTPVGMTKGRYQIVQNEQAYMFADALIGEGGANIVAAGKYGKPLGSKTYMALALDPFNVGEDPHQMFVKVLNSHDGSSGLTALLAPLRIACTNETVATFRFAAQRISIRHSSSWESRIHEARMVLGLVDRWEEAFQRQAKELLAAKVTNDQFTRFIGQLWGTPTKDASKRAHTLHDQRLTEVTALFTSSPTNDYGRGTAYAAWNAVTEYIDWVAPVRGGDSPEVARFARTLDGDKAGHKQKALTLLTKAFA